MDLMCTL